MEELDDLRVANEQQQEYLARKKQSLENLVNFQYRPMEVPTTDPLWEFINTENARDTGNEAMVKLAELPIEELIKISEQKAVVSKEPDERLPSRNFYSKKKKIE